MSGTHTFGRIGLAFAGLGFLASAGVWAASPATDNASDSAYSAGFNTGTNGGSGFGPWNITTVSGGSFISGGSNIRPIRLLRYLISGTKTTAET